jgi:hypothetical protein
MAEFCAANGIGLLPYGVVGGGFLSDRWGGGAGREGRRREEGRGVGGLPARGRRSPWPQGMRLNTLQHGAPAWPHCCLVANSCCLRCVPPPHTTLTHLSPHPGNKHPAAAVAQVPGCPGQGCVGQHHQQGQVRLCTGPGGRLGLAAGAAGGEAPAG